MEAVILAAGFGSRLGHHTHDKPKALLRVGDRPLIDYILESLKRNEIYDVVIVTGHKAAKLKNHVTENFDMNFTFVHNSLYRRTNNIYSLHLAMKAVTDGFYIINSDVFFHPGIFDRLCSCRKRATTLSVDTFKKLGEEEMKVKLDGDRVVEISKEIPPGEADGEYIGLAKIPLEHVEHLRSHVELVIENRGARVFYEEAFQSMIDYGLEIFYESTGNLPWIEIDTPHDLVVAREEVHPRIYG